MSRQWDPNRSLGYVSAIDSNGRTIFVADAHRDDRKRFVVQADEFLELESAVCIPSGASLMTRFCSDSAMRVVTKPFPDASIPLIPTSKACCGESDFRFSMIAGITEPSSSMSCS